MTVSMLARTSAGLFGGAAAADPDTLITAAGGNYVEPEAGDLRLGVVAGAGAYEVVGTLEPIPEPAAAGNDVFMPNILKQTITYWAPATPDGYGNRSFASPVSLKGRYEEKLVLFIDETGREARSDAQVLLGQDVLQQGYLYLGLSGAVDPSTVSGAHEIRGFEKIPSIRGTKFVRKALL